jgi:hypothetical protein
MYGEDKKRVQSFVGKIRRKRPLGRRRRKWADNIKIDHRHVSYRNKMEGRGLDSSGSGYGQVTGCSEHINEPSSFIKCGEVLDWLNNNQLPKDPAPWSWFVGWLVSYFLS